METIPCFPYLMAPNPLYQPKDFTYLESLPNRQIEIPHPLFSSSINTKSNA